MKKGYAVFAVAAAAVLLQAPAAQALNQETELLLIMLEQKGIITQQDAKNFESTINELTGGKKTTSGKADKDDDDDDEDEGIGRISDRLKLSGELSVDALRNHRNFEDRSVSGSDVTLTEAEISLDANIAEHVDAHISLKYEEEEEEGHNVFIDDAYVLIDGKDRYPLYAQAGKMYIPFGLFQTHFITDSAPQILGETNDAALVAGYKNKFVKVRAGAYNGEISESSETDNHIRDWVASLEGTLPEFQNMKTTIGLGYTSNLASSKELKERVSDPEWLEGEALDYSEAIHDYVGGINAYLNFSYAERVYFMLEYVGATDEFLAGELDFDDGRPLRPWAWSAELGGKLFNKLEGAIRYEKTNARVEPGEHFLAEQQYAGLLSYELFDNTTVALEHLFGEYDNNDDMNQTTLRVEVEF